MTKAIEVFRGVHLESTHDLHIAVVTAKGELLAYYGDPNRLTFARSSMKPLQAIPMVESGVLEEYNFTSQELALCCASHSGEKKHRKTVHKMLNKLGLEESNLQCGTHAPRDEESYRELIRNNQKLTSVYSNCSGKHTGMLAGCLKDNLDIQTYRNLNHPYQQKIIKTIADVSNYESKKIAISIDGCGVPVHRIPLINLALAFGRLAKSDEWESGNEYRVNTLKIIKDAMIQYPEMVAGTDRFDTDLMNAYQKRIVTKGGAEGVQCIGDTETGIGIALKVEDGNKRATSVASMEILKQLDIGSEQTRNKLKKNVFVSVLNARDEVVGNIHSNFNLKMNKNN